MRSGPTYMNTIWPYAESLSKVSYHVNWMPLGYSLGPILLALFLFSLRRRFKVFGLDALPRPLVLSWCCTRRGRPGSRGVCTFIGLPFVTCHLKAGFCPLLNAK